MKTHLSFSAKDYTRHISQLQFGDDIKCCSVSSLSHNSINEVHDLECPMKNPPLRFHTKGSVNG